MKIGNKLRGLRNEKGISVPALVYYLEISESTYRSYEVDKKFPSIKQLDKIAKYYGKDFLELLPAELMVSQKNNEVAIAQNFATIKMNNTLLNQYHQENQDLKAEVLLLKESIEK